MATAVEVSSSVARAARRRSLKVFLLPSLFPRPSSFAPSISTGGPGAVLSLPADVLRVIAELLSPNEILNVSLTSSHVRELLIPELYRTVHLRSSRACDSGLHMLAKRPDLCAHIRKLAVRPNYYLAWPARDTQLSEEWVAMMIEEMAETLTSLRTFDWDGLEMPRDALWLTLRKSCPELKEVFSNVGFQPLDPENELFKFDDLSIFSLSVRHGLGESDIFPPQEELPKQLWDMLLTRCPNLTELTLCSFSASHRLFDISRVTEGRWPQLASLTLGAFGYNADFTVLAAPAVPFATFLATHPTLTYLRLAWNFKRWMSPDDIPSLVLADQAATSASTLPFPPNLDTFSGIVQQLPTGAGAMLTSLDLMCEPLYAARAPALCAAMRELPALTSLELWVHVPEPRAGHEAYFRELWGAAPGLEDLHFMCTTAFGKKPLTELGRALRLLPKLRTFALTKGHRYADESMRASAIRVFNALAASAPWGSGSGSKSPTPVNLEDDFVDPAPRARLTQVSIRWARAACRNHLKQEGTYERVVPALPPPPSAPSSPVVPPPRTRGGTILRRKRGVSDATASTLNRNSLVLPQLTASQRRRSDAFISYGGTGAPPSANANIKEEKEREKEMVEAWERGLRALGGSFDRRFRFALPSVAAAQKQQQQQQVSDEESTEID
ncbi:hypothetical protein DFH06DRAFT_1308611 [Mycena polygramma]|nr:hypothetical protein DFH06DRAFT_1308611 [Mycena polygramma]